MKKMLILFIMMLFIGVSLQANTKKLNPEQPPPPPRFQKIINNPKINVNKNFVIPINRLLAPTPHEAGGKHFC
jgi:hypothetical protein